MVPNPGSNEAIQQGCTCPVLDNYHGQGFPYDGEIVFWYTEGCPLHRPNQGKGSPGGSDD